MIYLNGHLARPLDAALSNGSRVAVLRVLRGGGEVGKSGREIARLAGINHQAAAQALAGLAELGHEQEDAGEAFFAVVEELVYEVGLGAHAAAEQEREEEVGEAALGVQGADHLVALDAECGAGGDGGGGGHAQAGNSGDGLFAEEVARVEQGDGRLFAAIGDHGEAGAAALQVEATGGLGSLAEEDLLGREADEMASHTCTGEESGDVGLGIRSG